MPFAASLLCGNPAIAANDTHTCTHAQTHSWVTCAANDEQNHAAVASTLIYVCYIHCNSFVTGLWKNDPNHTLEVLR